MAMIPGAFGTRQGATVGRQKFPGNSRAVPTGPRIENPAYPGGSSAPWKPDPASGNWTNPAWPVDPRYGGPTDPGPGRTDPMNNVIDDTPITYGYPGAPDPWAPSSGSPATGLRGLLALGGTPLGRSKAGAGGIANAANAQRRAAAAPPLYGDPGPAGGGMSTGLGESMVPGAASGASTGLGESVHAPFPGSGGGPAAGTGIASGGGLAGLYKKARAASGAPTLS